MALMTEVLAHLDEVRSFYDALSPEYDLMTSPEQRFIHEWPFFHLLVERYHIKTALDAGAGSGFHSLLLAQLGVDVTALDISSKMTALTEKHAAERGLVVHTVNGGFSDIPSLMSSPFDAVFCLGNSLAHAESLDELTGWLRTFRTVLNRSGLVFLQNLNYDRILALKEKVLSRKEIGGKRFIRSYEYENNRIRFDISVERNGGSPERLSSVHLLPILRADLAEAVRSAGFTDIQTFGSIAMSPFAAKTSTDLVMLARTGNSL